MCGSARGLVPITANTLLPTESILLSTSLLPCLPLDGNAQKNQEKKARKKTGFFSFVSISFSVSVFF